MPEEPEESVQGQTLSGLLWRLAEDSCGLMKMKTPFPCFRGDGVVVC